MSHVIATAEGRLHQIELLDDGTVWAEGGNYDGQLGDGSTINPQSKVKVLNLNNVKAIAAGSHHSIALLHDGTVWAWGWGYWGQLGNNSKMYQCVPLQVNGLSDIVAIAAGYAHNIALKRDGTVWAWGYKESMWALHTPLQMLKNLDDIIAIEANGDESRAYTAYGWVCF